MGDPVAILGGDAPALGLGKLSWVSSRSQRRFTPVPACPPWGSCGGAAGRSHPQGKTLNGGTGHYTNSKTLNKRLSHGPNLLLSSLLERALLEKSRSTGGSPTTSPTEPEEGMSKQGKAAWGQQGRALHWHPQFELSYITGEVC